MIHRIFRKYLNTDKLNNGNYSTIGSVSPVVGEFPFSKKYCRKNVNNSFFRKQNIELNLWMKQLSIFFLLKYLLLLHIRACTGHENNNFLFFFFDDVSENNLPLYMKHPFACVMCYYMHCILLHLIPKRLAYAYTILKRRLSLYFTL